MLFNCYFSFLVLTCHWYWSTHPQPHLYRATCCYHEAVCCSANCSKMKRSKGAFTPDLCCQGSPGDVLKDPRVQCWIENYRNLLDAWRFWHKRAEFDILRGKLDPSSKPLAQVTTFISAAEPLNPTKCKPRQPVSMKLLVLYSLCL